MRGAAMGPLAPVPHLGCFPQLGPITRVAADTIPYAYESFCIQATPSPDTRRTTHQRLGMFGSFSSLSARFVPGFLLAFSISGVGRLETSNAFSALMMIGTQNAARFGYSSDVWQDVFLETMLVAQETNVLDMCNISQLKNKHAAGILQTRHSCNILWTSFWIFAIPLHHIAKVVIQQLFSIFPLVWREWHGVNAFPPPSIRIRPGGS